jgi:O-antigen ligase
MIEPPHNYFIIVSDETGIIGLVIFSALLIYILNLYVQNFRKIKTVENPTEIIILFWLFVSIIVIMQFDHYFYDIPLMSLLLWSILGIISGTAARNLGL